MKNVISWRQSPISTNFDTGLIWDCNGDLIVLTTFPTLRNDPVAEIASMHLMRVPRVWVAAVFVLSAVLGAAAPARADNIVISYSAAGVDTPNFAALCSGTTICDYGVETFPTSKFTSTSSGYTSSFNDGGAGTFNQPAGVSFKGAYTVGTGTNTSGTTNAWVPEAQNQYGGTNGNNYPELFGNGTSTPANYNLTLSATGVPGVNYFGVWVSALDPYNNLNIYDGTTLIANFTSAYLQTKLGNCTTTPPSPFCGNPTSQFPNADNKEEFVYINVFDLSGYITNVEFYDSGTTGFESSNHAVAYMNPVKTSGTVLIPEPPAVAIFGIGLAALGLRRRCRLAGWPNIV